MVTEYLITRIIVSNPDQRDCDFDGIGDACDTQRAPVSFPFVITQSWNNVLLPNATNLFALSASYQAMPYLANFNDQLPLNSVHSGSLEIDVVVINVNGNDNCYFSVNFGTQSKSFLSTGVNGSYSVTFDSVSSVYKYKINPIGGGVADGIGLNAITVTTTSVLCTLQVGAISYLTRYTFAQNASSPNNYFSQCINAGQCKYGTYRFPRNGVSYCACWSGAWDRVCTMDNANYTTTILTPWSDTPANTQRRQIGDLDPLNAPRNFGMDWVGHTTCPISTCLSPQNQWVLVV